MKQLFNKGDYESPLSKESDMKVYFLVSSEPYGIGTYIQGTYNTYT